MMTGVTADAGAGPLAGTQGEPVTEGLDGILARLRGYAGLGARFATWRAVLRIGPGMPSALAIRANAQALARYAAACQEAGLVPIAEPAVLMNGSASLGRCATVTSLVLLEVMSNLDEYGVDFASVVLRPSMVLPGGDPAASASPAEVASATLSALDSLPATLAGVAFLSGGQRPERATGNLAAMQGGCSVAAHVRVRPGADRPGAGRLAGRAGPLGGGQRALARRVALNVAAVQGRYRPDLEADYQFSAGPVSA